MDIINNIKNEIILFNEKFMTEAEDKFNYWEEHIKYVVQEALVLAEKYNADAEIVELGALLHDVASIAKIGTRKEHHINGAEIAGTILSKYNYPKEKIGKVKKCVFNHRSSKNLTDVEDICVADADILAHFDNIPMLLDIFFNKNKISYNNLSDLKNKMKEFFDHDYNDLSERTKQEFTDRYKLLCQVILGL